MINKKMEGLTDNQLLLLEHFEKGITSYIRKCLNECANKRLQVSVGMALKRREGDEPAYKLTSNAAFSISDSFYIEAKTKEYIEVAGIDAIVPTGHLRIDLNFKEKEETAQKDDENIEKKKNDETPSFFPQTPKYSLDQVVLGETTKQEIKDALNIIRYKELIYDKWGFKDIDPVPRSVINLYGEPGTGKTMTAHAIAKSLNMPILLLNYSEIESKYVGEAPKNLQKAFSVAKETNSVLFFDEADSFLGRRIEDVRHGSDQALNSLRSQMLILLEEFSGVVIFATNLVSNFDAAFNSRILKHIYFGLPNEEARTAILWHTIPTSLPHDETINKESISEESKIIDGFSGRDIKNAILDMLLRKAGENSEDACFCIADLHNALLAKVEQKKQLREEEQRALKNRIARKLKEKVAEQSALKEQDTASGNSDSKPKAQEA